MRAVQRVALRNSPGISRNAACNVVVFGSETFDFARAELSLAGAQVPVR
jgi:hypothetical protein